MHLPRLRLEYSRIYIFPGPFGPVHRWEGDSPLVQMSFGYCTDFIQKGCQDMLCIGDHIKIGPYSMLVIKVDTGLELYTLRRVGE